MAEQLDLFALDEVVEVPKKKIKDSPLPKEVIPETVQDEVIEEPREKRVALFVGDKVRVKESLIHAAKDVNAEDYYYFKEYEGLVGTIESKNYAKKGAYYEVSYKNKRLAVFNHHEIEKVEK